MASYGTVPADAVAPATVVPRRALAAVGFVGAWALALGAARSASGGSFAALAATEASSTLVALAATEAAETASSSHPVSVDEALERCDAVPRAAAAEAYGDCPAGDATDWCSRMRSAFRSGKLAPEDCDSEMCFAMATSPCAASCVDRDGNFAATGYFESCAWDAVAHFDDFCDGAWSPTSRRDFAAAEPRRRAGNGFDVCDQRAFCAACGADAAAAESCRAALAATGGAFALPPSGEMESFSGAAVLLNRAAYCEGR